MVIMVPACGCARCLRDNLANAAAAFDETRELKPSVARLPVGGSAVSPLRVEVDKIHRGVDVLEPTSCATHLAVICRQRALPYRSGSYRQDRLLWPVTPPARSAPPPARQAGEMTSLSANIRASCRSARYAAITASTSGSRAKPLTPAHRANTWRPRRRPASRQRLAGGERVKLRVDQRHPLLTQPRQARVTQLMTGARRPGASPGPGEHLIDPRLTCTRRCPTCTSPSAKPSTSPRRSPPNTIARARRVRTAPSSRSTSPGDRIRGNVRGVRTNRAPPRPRPRARRPASPRGTGLLTTPASPRASRYSNNPATLDDRRAIVRATFVAPRATNTRYSSTSRAPA